MLEIPVYKEQSATASLGHQTLGGMVENSVIEEKGINRITGNKCNLLELALFKSCLSYLHINQILTIEKKNFLFCIFWQKCIS
jgi:hypothetical protein